MPSVANLLHPSHLQLASVMLLIHQNVATPFFTSTSVSTLGDSALADLSIYTPWLSPKTLHCTNVMHIVTFLKKIPDWNTFSHLNMYSNQDYWIWIIANLWYPTYAAIPRWAKHFRPRFLSNVQVRSFWRIISIFILLKKNTLTCLVRKLGRPRNSNRGAGV